MKLDLKLDFVFAPLKMTFCPAFNYDVGIKRTPLNHCSDLVPDYEQSTVFANELQRKCHVIVTSTRGENLPFQTAMVVVLLVKDWGLLTVRGVTEELHTSLSTLVGE